MSQKFYAFGSGMFGCLYDNVDGPYLTATEAADVAGDLLELQECGRIQLRKHGYLNLRDYRETVIDSDDGSGEGADYVEVFAVDENWTASRF